MNAASVHLALAAMVALVLCIPACRFLPFHGGDSDSVRVPKPPRNAFTWDQFLQANRDRGLSEAILRKRFIVADANDDGFLSPAEIQSHRARAEWNKSQDN